MKEPNRVHDDWKLLAEQVTREANPERLLELVGELNRCLDESREDRDDASREGRRETPAR